MGGRNRREEGRVREEQAAEYLREQGYQIVEHNFYAGHKEIDLIARDGEYLVFIEVKYSKNQSMGDPLERIHTKKQSRIRYAAKQYLYQNHLSFETPCRFDAVRILGNAITLIKNAF